MEILKGLDEPCELHEVNKLRLRNNLFHPFFSVSHCSRQFNSELESKSIKLIFNGQILDDDTKSLTQCGLFSEAVVHCLMLQKRSAATSTETSGSIVTRQRAATGNTHLLSSLLNANWNAPLLIYIFLIIIVTLTLSFCWYCR